MQVSLGYLRGLEIKQLDIEDFITDEKQKALHKLSNSYSVAPEALGEVIDKYVWLGQEVPKSDITPLLKGDYKFQERRQLSSRLSEAVNEYTELYHSGF